MDVQELGPGDPPRLGRFELLGRLGEGGQGIVYLGRGPGPGEDRVAVKVLRSSARTDALQRLGRELEAVHQVQPFVTARVIEAAADGDRRYVVSEFIDGPSLHDRVEASGPLAEGELLRLAVGTATALTAIHGAGVVHRDFKPANVLLGPDGPRVVDFGIARLTDRSTLTSGLIGTPSYMAPEQLKGERPGSAVDIFAWAVTIIFAATGRSAFGADTVPAVMHRILFGDVDLAGVPASLQPLLTQCLSKEPAGRPTARDVLLRLVDPSLAGFVPTTGPGQAVPGPGPSVPGFGPSVPGIGPSAAGFGPSAPGAGPSVPGFGPSAAGFGPSAPGAGPSIADAGPSAAGFGPSVLGPAPRPYPGATSLDPASGRPLGTGPVPGGVSSFDTRQVAGPGRGAPGPGYDPTQMSGPRGASGYADAPGGGPTAPHRPRSRRPVLIGAGGLVVVAVAAVAVVLATRGSPGSSPNAGSTSGRTTLQASPTPAASTSAASAPASSAPAAGPGPTIPAAFAGTWTGTAQLSAISNPGVSLPNSIALTLAAGARSGQENNDGCATPVVAIGVASGRLTMRETTVSANCVSGTVTLTRKGANLDYHWTNGVEQNISTLNKS